MPNKKHIICRNRLGQNIDSSVIIFHEIKEWTIEGQIIQKVFLSVSFLLLDLGKISIPAKLFFLSIGLFFYLKYFEKPYSDCIRHPSPKYYPDEEDCEDDSVEQTKSSINIQDCTFIIYNIRVLEDNNLEIRITASAGGEYWHVWKRVTEFENLRTRLMSDFPTISIPTINIPRAENRVDSTKSYSYSADLERAHTNVKGTSPPLVFPAYNPPISDELCRSYQIALMDWVANIQTIATISNHSHIRAFLGMPPYKYSNKFGEPLQQIPRIIPVESKKKASRPLYPFLKGTSIYNCVVADEPAIAKQMYRDSGLSHRFKVRGLNYMTDKKKVRAEQT